MKNFQLCLIFIIILFSCNKEENQLSFPIILVSTDFKVVTDVRLFTFKGEIKDTSIINKYLSVCDVFPINEDLSIPVTNRDSIIYLTADTLLFSKIWPESYNKLDKRIQKRNDGYLYFYKKDTTYLVKEKSFFPSINDEIDNIISNLGIYKPICAIQDLPEKFGYTYLVKYLGSYIAKGSYYKLEFPFLSYRFTRGVIGFPGIFYSRSSQFFNNKFDPNIIGLMKEGDTLAIKESLFVYENIK